MDKNAIEKAARQLDSRTLVIGAMLRRSACAKLAEDSGPLAVGHLVRALRSDDPEVARTADSALCALKNEQAIEALCDIAISDPAGRAAEIARENDYQPANVSRRCVFFLLTGQVEKYLDLDFEFQHLRAEYEVAEESLKRRIAEFVRQSGDARLLGLFEQRRRSGPIDKRAAELDEREAAVVLQVYARNSRWAEIFAMLFHIPLSSAMSALDALEKSGWKPENEQDAALLNELIRTRKDVGEIPAAPPDPDVALGTVLGKWIRAGREGDMASASAEELRRRVQEAAPPEAVAALSALSAKGQVTPADIETARTHKHWPVRLACLALCEIAPEFAFSDAPVGGEGGGMWIDQLAPPILDAVVYRRRGIALNLDQVESLQTVLAGKGAKNKQRAACGRILCALGAYHLRHTIEIDEEMVVRVSETEIEIEG